MQTRCPHCKGKIELSITASGGVRNRGKVYESSAKTPFSSSALAIGGNSLPAVIPPAYEAERRGAAFMPTREANVIVPLLQSVITAIFVAVPVGVGVTWIMYQYGGRTVTFWNAAGTGCIWFLLSAFGVAFLSWQFKSRSYDDLLWHIETLTGVDINNDEQVGKPEPQVVRVEVESQGRWQFADLPGRPDALYDFANGVTIGTITFSERGAIQVGYGAEMFRKLRDIFIERGWAEWKDPANRQQGVNLRLSGTSVLRKISNTPVGESTPNDEGDDFGMSPNYVDKGSKGRGSWG